VEEDMNKTNQGELFMVGLFVAAGLAVGGYFVGQTMYNAKVALNTAESKGLAERRVKADRANWKIRFTVAGSSRDEIPGLYKLARRQQKTILGLLRENGFTEDEIDPGVFDYNYREFRGHNNMLVDQIHSLACTVDVETGKVDLVSKARAKMNGLIAEGINIENIPPTYRYTKINEIKPDMLKDATRNARIAANEFAANAGVKVGGIHSARQGSFTIRDVGEDYGDTARIEKDVRVVTTINFYLTE